jgi:hypothetical protein
MDTIYIYRMQDSHGYGPYRRHSLERMDRELYYELFCLHGRDPHKPVPALDSMKRWPTRREICGFVSLDQAQRWFPVGLRIRLGKYGFRLARVRVARITAVSDYQCLAIRRPR